MNRTDTCTREHRVSRLKDHRQIDRDTITLLHTQLFQHIGKAANMLVKLVICDRFRNARVIPLPDNSRLVAARLQMAVNAVIADIEFAIFIPADM